MFPKYKRTSDNYDKNIHNKNPPNTVTQVLNRNYNNLIALHFRAATCQDYNHIIAAVSLIRIKLGLFNSNIEFIPQELTPLPKL